ncbi:MAG TPA: hypothetical protein VK097_08805 [Lentibacillus sp.]|uniref:hypothetical protein n=1 Tax=Lentibacillus sp. TaxID=1925746 RepID=UPI002B4AD876|nr:hypothetical protein [Lentibacillus sp.]HLR62527.1 hypothetical protein [Lentibacillus sp.]
MQWKWDMTSNKKLEQDIMLALIILLIAVSLYLDRSLSFVFIRITCVYLIGLKWYNREAARKLTLDMPYESIKVFQGSLDRCYTLPKENCTYQSS